MDQTLRVLAKHRILSAPVRSKQGLYQTLAGLAIAEGNEGSNDSDDNGNDAAAVCTSPSASGSLSGFIDIRDVLSSFLI